MLTWLQNVVEDSRDTLQQQITAKLQHFNDDPCIVSSLTDEEVLWDIRCAVHDLAGAAGFEHYEVSAFARPDSYCRHNLNYWDGQRGWLGASTHVDLVFCGHMVAIPTRYY